jgi:hypothetical protein
MGGYLVTVRHINQDVSDCDIAELSFPWIDNLDSEVSQF